MSQEIPIYNGPIAVFDFLGFKSFVEENALQNVINSYAHEITSAYHSTEIIKEDFEFMVYSDTIAIRLVNISDEGFLHFVRAIQLINGVFLIKCQLSNSVPIPLRGAISIGEYSWYNGDITAEFGDRPSLIAKKVNFIVGQAIIDAHEHEKTQQWIGISLNEKTAHLASERFPNAWQELNEKRLVLQHDIPIKTGTIKGYVINPTFRPLFKKSFLAFLDRSAQLFQNVKIDYETKLKYYNTMKLLNDIHVNDDLIPHVKWAAKANQEIIEVVIDKSKYDVLINYFDEKIRKEHTEFQINLLNVQLQLLENPEL